MKNLLKYFLLLILFIFVTFNLSAYYIYPIISKINPGITITSPNGGENLLVDSTYNITWTAYMTSGILKISYSTTSDVVSIALSSTKFELIRDSYLC